MAKVGVFDAEQKKWFRYDSDSEVLLKYIDKGRVNTILMRGAEVAKSMKAPAGAMQDILLGKEAVFGWRKVDAPDEPGLQFPDGTTMPFTPDNRNRLMTKSKRFSEFVYGTCTDENRYLEDEPVVVAPEELKELDALLDELSKEEAEGSLSGNG